MGRFIPNPVGLKVLELQLARSPEFEELANVLMTMVRSFTPVASEDEHLGTTSDQWVGELQKSVTVGLSASGHYTVYTDDFRMIFIEFGTVDEQGVHTPAFAPFRRGLEEFAALIGGTIRPHGVSSSLGVGQFFGGVVPADVLP